MAHTNYQVTITEYTNETTTYTAWVTGRSKTQALVKAAAMAGQEKTRLEYERMGRPADLEPVGLMDPEFTITPCLVGDFWDKRDTVEVTR